MTNDILLPTMSCYFLRVVVVITVLIAIHGICYDAPNMQFCSDVMGSVCDWIEENIGGVAYFINGDAGDVNPGNNPLMIQSIHIDHL